MAEHLTAGLPGVGGEIRRQPADFLVEELPLYVPCGTGEHLYLDIEKEGLTTFDLLNQLARALGCTERDLGYAGLKDARAISRQTISVPLRTSRDVASLQLPGIRILGVRQHTNKLRPGHLAGNRFRIRIRQPHPDARERAAAILGVLEDRGVPNRFGEQRYGLLGNSDHIGQAILRGDFQRAAAEIVGDPQKIKHPGWQRAAAAYRAADLDTAIQTFPRHCQAERRLVADLKSGKSWRMAVLDQPRNLLRLYLSAYQSSLFDRLLDTRLTTMEQLWQGDLACKHSNGACFTVYDPATEQLRADRFEISPTAPLYGYKVTLAEGQAGELETGLLTREQISLESFRLGRGLDMPGERRPLRVPLRDLGLEQDKDDLLVSFLLPRGSFATAVLAELMKTPQEANGNDAFADRCQ